MSTAESRKDKSLEVPTAKDSSVGHRPVGGAGSWVFDAEVTAVFDDMLVRSVPFYEEAQRLIASVCEDVLTKQGALIDLGVATASTLRTLAPLLKAREIHTFGVDPSEAMIKTAKTRYPDCEYFAEGALEWLHDNPDTRFDATVLSLTLQFIPIEHRAEILHEVYAHTRPGGAVLLYEKCLGDSHFSEALYTRYFYDFKNANGYSWESIMAKRKALENVLVPLPREMNRSMLEAAGFRVVPLAQWCNFSLFVGYRD